jgi:type VI secretion system protein ImpG
MDSRLVHLYNQELAHLREMGAEFAQQFPKIAGRLGISGTEVPSDPYVERLLEGTAFLAARVQLKLDAEFPRFTQRLLEIVYPGYVAPTPAMLIAQLQPDLDEANLAPGVVVRRGSAMRSNLGKGDTMACEFRTAHDVTLWPIKINSAEYFTLAPDLPLASLRYAQQIKGGIRLHLESTAGLPFKQVALDSLHLFVSGIDDVAYKLHELCLGACLGGLVLPPTRPVSWGHRIAATDVRAMGFDDSEALLPPSLRGFQGYRLLQEYFAFAERFRFVAIDGLSPALRQCAGNQLELVLLFSRGDTSLQGIVDASSFALHCTPAINLFPKRADRIHITSNTYDYHVVPDRTRPMDFEVYDVSSVTGYGVGNESEQRFLPFYAAYEDSDASHRAYYTLQREIRVLSEAQKRTGGFRSGYVGTEVYLSLVDPEEAPFSSDLRQLAVTTLCTNRDLPLDMPVNVGRTDFTLSEAAPVKEIRCIKGPSAPFSPLAKGSGAWRFIDHLSLNYLSLLDTDESQGAAALRDMLALYATSNDPGVRRQIDAVRSVRVEPAVRRLPLHGPIAFGRGLEITLEVDELAFQGASAFLFGCVMQVFFSRHVSLNSFTETVLRSLTRGEIMRWVPRCGARPIL